MTKITSFQQPPEVCKVQIGMDISHSTFDADRLVCGNVQLPKVLLSCFFTGPLFSQSAEQLPVKFIAEVWGRT